MTGPRAAEGRRPVREREPVGVTRPRAAEGRGPVGVTNPRAAEGGGPVRVAGTQSSGGKGVCHCDQTQRTRGMGGLSLCWGPRAAEGRKGWFERQRGTIYRILR